MDIEGRIRGPDEPAIVADWRGVSPAYFETVGTTLLAGRVFEPSDYIADAPPVRIVDRLFAERLWPGGTAVGHRIREADNTDDERFATIVGVVESVRDYALESEARMATYEPRLSVYRTYLIVATEGDPRNLANPIADALRDIEPEIGISDVRTMEDRLDDAIAPQRLSLLLMQSFSVIALLLTVVGLYGLINNAVSRGGPEIGVRMALGASSATIVYFVTSFGIRVALLGIAIGSAGGLFASRLMSHLLFKVSPIDPASYLLAALLVGSLSLLACWLPSRRAAKLNPVDTLRAQ
jgi:ABC-type antimicrobial peptide transport system permease subunit